MTSWRLYVTFLFIVTFAAAEIKNKGWWKNVIFYQLYPRSFKDYDGDGVGDIKGITSKLEHFVDLNINGIWLSPIYPSPMVDAGYDITNFYDIDKKFGTLQDFKELVKKAKILGIRIVLDFVPNHTSDKHEWFIKSVNSVGKYKDYYVWRRGRNNNTEPPNNWLSVFGGPGWTYNEKRGLWYFHQFDYRQPDLDFTNPNVHREMKKILYFWLQMGIDGFRVDAIPNVYENDKLWDEPRTYKPNLSVDNYLYYQHIYTTSDPRAYGLIQSWTRIIDEWANAHNAEEKIIMTEGYASLENMVRYYSYGSQIPFNFYLRLNLTNKYRARDFKNVIDKWMMSLPEVAVPNWVTSNHDIGRVNAKFTDEPDLVVVLTLILPGIACVYYGEEICMTNHDHITWKQTQDPRSCRTNPELYQAFSRDPCRTPFQWDDTPNAGFSNGSKTWLPVNPNYKILNLAKQKQEPQSHYKIFQTLAKLRATSDILKKGSLITDSLHNNTVLLVARQISNEGIVLIYNFSLDTVQTVNVSNYFTGAVNATVITSSVTSSIKWGTTVQVSDVQLSPTTFLILRGSRHSNNR